MGTTTTPLADIVDPITAAIATLLEGVALGELVDDRVFGGSLPTQYAESMPQSCLVVQQAGAGSYGTSDDTMAREVIRVDLVAWGRTEQDAARVSEAANVAAKYARRGVRAGVLVHSFRRQAGPFQFRDPDTDWPAVTRTYLLTYGDAPAARTLV